MFMFFVYFFSVVGFVGTILIAVAMFLQWRDDAEFAEACDCLIDGTHVVDWSGYGSDDESEEK